MERVANRDVSMHEKDRIRTAAGLLYRSTQKIRILTHIAWPQSHRDHFLKNQCYTLPKIEYPPFDATDTRACLAEARALIQRRIADRLLAGENRQPD